MVSRLNTTVGKEKCRIFFHFSFKELSEIPFCELEELKHRVGSKRYGVADIWGVNKGLISYKAKYSVEKDEVLVQWHQPEPYKWEPFFDYNITNIQKYLQYFGNLKL